MAFSKLDVSVFNREQNQEFRTGMLEREERQRMYKEKEVEEEIDYLGPYLARLGYPDVLTYQEALDVKYACLEEFRDLLVNRAKDIQQQFEKVPLIFLMFAFTLSTGNLCRLQIKSKRFRPGILKTTKAFPRKRKQSTSRRSTS